LVPSGARGRRGGGGRPRAWGGSYHAAVAAQVVFARVPGELGGIPGGVLGEGERAAADAASTGQGADAGAGEGRGWVGVVDWRLADCTTVPQSSATARSGEASAWTPPAAGGERDEGGEAAVADAKRFGAFEAELAELDAAFAGFGQCP